MTPKIFCIGLSKTGTNSLTTALRLLGFRAVHWDYTRHVFRYTESGIQINFRKFEKRDAFADTPIARIYRELDQHFPGAKFILTLRQIDEWKVSFKDQFYTPVKGKFSQQLHRDLYGTTSYTEEKCENAFICHRDRVREYFKGREKDFLELDIAGGDGWEKLCPFLERPIPEVAFPHSYARQDRSATISWIRRWLRPLGSQ